MCLEVEGSIRDRSYYVLKGRMRVVNFVDDDMRYRG